MSIELIWQDAHLDDVIAYWVEGYKQKGKKKITDYEYYIDAAKKTVILRVFVKAEGKSL